MNIAKAVHLEEGDRVSVGALAEKLRIATGADGLDKTVTHMSAVNFGPRDFVRLFGSSRSESVPAPSTPERLTDRVTGDAACSSSPDGPGAYFAWFREGPRSGGVGSEARSGQGRQRLV